MKRWLLAFSSLVMLSACSDMPEWMGGGDDKVKLEGDRKEVIIEAPKVKVDAALAGASVTVPSAENNAAWSERGGSASGLTGNLAWTGSAHEDSVAIGDGNGWKQYSAISPVVAQGVVFAVDSRGFVTAHDASHISTVKWKSKSLVENDEPDVLGGGIATDNGKVFVTTGYGKVAALDAASGKELWKTSVGIPLKNAPKVQGDKVYALSADNQLFVLDAAKGTQLWNHRGMTENVGFATAVAPSVKDNVVLAPYSSGEIRALDTNSGQELWGDTLILSRHTTATGGFSGISGAPVIAGDTVYTGDSGGFFAAITLLSGRRLWEQDIATLNPAWIAGEYLYLLSSTQELTCVTKADGRVKWTQQLPRYEDEVKRKGAYVWRGPVMADGKLLIAGQHGKMLSVSPKDGTTLATTSIPDNITDAPVIAGGKLYFITQDARLHVLY